MCIFERINNEYQRILNIEFKNKNTKRESIEKDIQKLVSEKVDGVFIHLLENTNQRTFSNERETGIFDKLYKSFFDFQTKWNDEHKSIRLIIISLKQKILIYRVLKKNDFENLKDVFFIENHCGSIEEIKGNGWETQTTK